MIALITSKGITISGKNPLRTPIRSGAHDIFNYPVKKAPPIKIIVRYRHCTFPGITYPGQHASTAADIKQFAVGYVVIWQDQNTVYAQEAFIEFPFKSAFIAAGVWFTVSLIYWVVDGFRGVVDGEPNSTDE